MPLNRRRQCNRAHIFAKPFLPVVGAALALTAPNAFAGAAAASPPLTLHIAAPLAPTASIIGAGASWPLIFWAYYERIWHILKRYYTPPPQDMNTGMAAVVDHYNTLGVPGDLLIDEVLDLKDAAANLLALFQSPPDGADLVLAEQFKQVLAILAVL